MNWINLRTELLRSPAFVNARPGAIETWLRVMAYCCEQENGGCIKDGKTWTERAWLATCGVTLAEIEQANPLIHYREQALYVEGYPAAKEAEVQAKRAAGKTGGENGAKSRARSRANSTANGSGSPVCRTEGEGEGEGKENGNGNGKENPNGTGTTNQPPPASPVGGEGKKKLKASNNLPTTDLALGVASLFKRRATTPWSPKERKAYSACVKRGALTLDTLALLTPYYEHERAKGGDGHHRRDLQTFLNNLEGEIDRAKAFSEDPKANDRVGKGVNGERERKRSGEYQLGEGDGPEVFDPSK